MTTYGDNTTNRFYHLVRKGYRYTYALIDFVTGEVRTMACDRAYLPLKDLYNRLDGLRRECEHKGEMCHLLLVDCRTGEAIEEVWHDYGLDEVLGDIADPVALIGAQ